MRLGLLAVLACSGCELIANVPNAVRSTADGSLGDDGDVNADIDALPIDALPCYGAFDPICMVLPDADITLPPDINTGTSALCTTFEDPAGVAGSLCLIAGKTITSVGGAPTTVTGPRPLALVASQEITIGGMLDVHNTANAGCVLTAATQQAGGAGGSRGGKGGPGGDSNNNGVGGTSTALPASLVPGCVGGQGAGNNGGAGGGGGGSVLLASVTIDITASALINASGIAGNGGQNQAGGGGGGAGGVIIVDAPTTTIAGTLLAAGGGGGEGGNGGVMIALIGPGNNGKTLNPAAPGTPAAGGTGRTGGDGGQGGHLAVHDGASGGKSGAGIVTGGGGGGGTGLIIVPAATASVTGTVIPAAQQQ